MSTEFLVQDKGEPDEVAQQAEQHALGELPVEVLIGSACRSRRPLMIS